MSKLVDFKSAKDASILASTYKMNHTDDDGNVVEIELNGDETISTNCPGCGYVSQMSLHDFCCLSANDHFDLYGTIYYCVECSNKL